MIPITYPTTLVGNVRTWRVNALSSITGLKQWIDYIPVAETTINSTYLNTYGVGANLGAIAATQYNTGSAGIDFTNVYQVNPSGLKAWIDYIPVNGTVVDFFAGGINLFFNKADYNSYSGSPTKTLVDAATLVTLGITNAGGINGTYINPSGNLATKTSGTAPRLQYSLTSIGDIVGLISEPAATNLFKYSGDFTQVSVWNYFSTVGAATTGPDGTSNMQKLVGNVGSGDYYYYQTIAMTSGTRLVTSYYVKAGGMNWIQLRPTDGGAGLWRACFNLSNGTIGTTAGTGVTAGIEPGPNGTYRIWIAYTPTTTANGNVTFFIVNADNTQTVVGDGSSGVYVWGAQTEVCPKGADYPSTLIPTGATTVTRTADTVRPGSSFISQAGPQTTVVGAVVSKAAAGSDQYLLASTDNGRVLYVQAGGTLNSFDGTTYTYSTGPSSGVPFAASNRYGSSANAVSVNGGAIVTGSFDGSMGAGGVVGIGDDGSGFNTFFGKIRRLGIAPVLASDAQLQQLSAGTL